MNTVDKVIRQCFKDTSQAFMMIIFGALFTSLLLAFGFTAVLAPVCLVIMVVGLYKIIAYLFYKSIYAEESVMYQMLPITAEEIIISRVFVGMVAWTLFYLTFAESLVLGITFLDSDVGVIEVINELYELIYTIGTVAFVCFAAIFLTSIFLEVVLIFVGITFFNTSVFTKKAGFLRGMAILGTWGLVKFSEILFTNVLDLAVVGNMKAFYIATAVLVFASIVVGCAGCGIIKNRLEYNLQL